MIYDVRKVQLRLAVLGFSPGPADGIWGPRTRNAVLEYQASNGLAADGVVGPQTRTALFGKDAAKPQPSQAVPTEMPWLAEAARLMGTTEVAGPGSNPVIMDWADHLDVDIYVNDEIPWCGLFVAHCVRTGLPEAELPATPLLAGAWDRFGVGSRPALGAVLRFWRESPTSWKGHVGFYWAEDATHYHVLGGNQGNRVSVVRISRNRLVTARWPDGVDNPMIQRIASPSGVLISTSEA